jgi:hypothetical protein
VKTILTLLIFVSAASAAEIYKEPHVRYLIADMTLGGAPEYYEKFSKDAVPAKAVKEWRAGVRALNPERFERKRVKTPAGESMRVVFKGTEQTITGADIVLTSDMNYEQAPMRLALADLTLGRPVKDYESKKSDPSIAEALKRWEEGTRAVNTNLFTTRGEGDKRQLVYRSNGKPLDGALVKLNTDPHYTESWVRYLIAEITLGGSREKILAFGQRYHDYNCLVAVDWFDAGHRVTNLERFEFKPVNGKGTVVYKGTEKRIDPFDVRLSSDL